MRMVCREDGPARIRGSLQLHCRVEPSCLHVKWGADFGWLSRVDPSGMLVGLEMDPELNPCEGDVWGGGKAEGVMNLAPTRPTKQRAHHHQIEEDGGGGGFYFTHTC